MRFAEHIVDDPFGITGTAAVVFLPGFLGQKLHEGIQTLVEPGPLALVGIDHHGEPGVADFVHDHGHQRVLGMFTRNIHILWFFAEIGSVFVWSWTIESDHRVFHTTLGPVHGDRNRVRVIKYLPGVDVDGVDDRLRRELIPQGLRLLWIEGHAHYRITTRGFVAHGVPDETAGCCKGKITHIGGLEAPGPGSAGPGF